MRQKKVTLTFFATIFVLLLFAPILTRTASTLDDTADSLKVSVSTSPTRIQEGYNTTITTEIHDATLDKTYNLGINVSNPVGTFSVLNIAITTDGTGFGSNSTEYWKAFTENVNTDYVGAYLVAVNNITTGETVANTSFTVGLTHKMKYARNKNVSIQGSGYDANKNVTIKIELNETQMAEQNRTTNSKGIVNDTWLIPKTATPGVYTVGITNATSPSTVKNPPDTQDFYVEVWTCQIQGRNLANEPVANLTIKVYNDTNVPAQFLNLNQTTNENGTASFMLAIGNYTFKAFWKQVELGNLSVPIRDDIEEELLVQLSNLEMTVVEEATNKTIPFIELRLEYNNTIETTETNLKGIALIHNLFTNVNYTVEAERYGLPLPSLLVEILPHPQPNELTVEFPTYTMFVHVKDSEKNPAEGVKVEAYEWSSGLTQSKTTDSNGNATFSLTFGRYRVKAYSGTFLLNETPVNLTQNQSFNLYLSVYNIDFTVSVVDYLRQPIPNARVQIERKTGTKYEVTGAPSFTGPDGHVTFSSVLGGDSRISIYVEGRLSGTQDLYLINSKQVTLNLNGYVVVVGYAVEISQFVTAIAIAMLVVACIVALTYKRLLKISIKSRKAAPSVKKSL